MKTTTIVAAAMVAAAATMPGAAEAASECKSWHTPEDLGYDITSVTRDYNAGSASTTFCFTVEVAPDAPHDLSHWTLGLCDTYTAADVLSASFEGSSEFGTDPTTGLFGFKWDIQVDKGTSETFCLELDGNIPLASDTEAGSTVSSYKGSTKCASAEIDGPGCGPAVCAGCPPGMEADPATCECSCMAIECDEGRSQNQETCVCECDPVDCGDGEQNPETCECGCPAGSPTAADCGYATYDEASCSCVCPDAAAHEAACEGTWYSAPLCLCVEEGDVVPTPPATGCKGVEARCGCPLVNQQYDGQCLEIRWIEGDSGVCSE